METIFQLIDRKLTTTRTYLISDEMFGLSFRLFSKRLFQHRLTVWWFTFNSFCVTCDLTFISIFYMRHTRESGFHIIQCEIQKLCFCGVWLFLLIVLQHRFFLWSETCCRNKVYSVRKSAKTFRGDRWVNFRRDLFSLFVSCSSEQLPHRHQWPCRIIASCATTKDGHGHGHTHGHTHGHDNRSWTAL